MSIIPCGACVEEWDLRQTKLEQSSDSKDMIVTQVKMQGESETGQRQ